MLHKIILLKFVMLLAYFSVAQTTINLAWEQHFFSGYSNSNSTILINEADQSLLLINEIRNGLQFDVICKKYLHSGLPKKVSSSRTKIATKIHVRITTFFYKFDIFEIFLLFGGHFEKWPKNTFPLMGIFGTFFLLMLWLMTVLMMMMMILQMYPNLFIHVQGGLVSGTGSTYRHDIVVEAGDVDDGINVVDSRWLWGFIF